MSAAGNSTTGLFTKSEVAAASALTVAFFSTAVVIAVAGYFVVGGIATNEAIEDILFGIFGGLFALIASSVVGSVVLLLASPLTYAASLRLARIRGWRLQTASYFVGGATIAVGVVAALSPFAGEFFGSQQTAVWDPAAFAADPTNILGTVLFAVAAGTSSAAGWTMEFRIARRRRAGALAREKESLS